MGIHRCDQGLMLEKNKVDKVDKVDKVPVRV